MLIGLGGYSSTWRGREEVVPRDSWCCKTIYIGFGGKNLWCCLFVENTSLIYGVVNVGMYHLADG